MTLRTGVPESVDPDLLHYFPPGIEIIRVPSKPTGSFEVEFWIPPFHQSAAVEVFPHLKGVKVAQSMLAGVDWLLKLVPATVQVCDGQGLHNAATAEWVLAAILASLKYFPFYCALQAEGNWRRRKEVNAAYRLLHNETKTFNPPVLVEELAGKTVLIVGYGSIGKSIEDRLLPFGINVLRVARSSRPGVEPVSALKSLLPTADIVVLIVPLTAKTTGMIGAEEIALMRQGALLVNAARGPVVNTEALMNALSEGKIRAAIDVSDPEPLPEDHPLWHAPNLLITPHIAASSPRFLQRSIAFAAEQAARYMAGKPLLNTVEGDY